MQLAEHLVEQVSQCGCVPIAMCTPTLVMLTGGACAAGGGECPDPAGRSQPIVLDAPVGDGDRLTGGAGDGRGSGVCLQRSVSGESCEVITDLGENPGAGEVGEPGKLVTTA
ncbi:hypothetical protein IFM12275_24500 [Nocardia sputorum]|nr:hypothetical protein IFM12275_24500 [Nocardia sputorum]